MNKLTLLILTFLATDLVAQPCKDLIEKVNLPVAYSLNPQLPPDPCDALSSYGTERILTVSERPEYLEVRKRIRVVVETVWDSETCTAETKELSRDTVIVGQQKIYSASNVPTGGYWTVRMELMVYAPVSRPVDALATKLPNGRLQDYWVIHTGQFNTIDEAKQATKQLKSVHPEFCRAYAYYLPEGCKSQYKYQPSNL